MNRIICDICGSEYPENEERCPICSYPRQGNEKLVAAAAEASKEKVKGGRFSSKNVKKRRKAQLRNEKVMPVRDPDRPLFIVITILLIAIILVSAYIAVRFLRGRDIRLPIFQDNTSAAATPAVTSEPREVPCIGITLDDRVVTLTSLGEQHQLNVRFKPADTTDTPVYVSANPAIAEISETGLITAVGSGETTITITCGESSKTFNVFCLFEGEETLPSDTSEPVTTEPEATETEATEPKETEPKETEPKVTEPKETEPKPAVSDTLTLNPNDATCDTAGEVFTIYPKLGNNSIERSEITWTSSDSAIAKVDNGIVTAVSKGEATITAEYQGKKATCIVRCSFENPEPTEDEPDQQTQENQGGSSAAGWKVRPADDVSIIVGESFSLNVKNSAGETADVVWTMSEEGIVSVDGKTVTGLAPGIVTLKTEVNGVALSCIVRVS